MNLDQKSSYYHHEWHLNTDKIDFNCSLKLGHLAFVQMKALKLIVVHSQPHFDKNYFTVYMPLSSQKLKLVVFKKRLLSLT